jgi:hypothetical protein
MSTVRTQIPVVLTMMAVLGAGGCAAQNSGTMLSPNVAAPAVREPASPDKMGSVLKMLAKEVVIGSTVDPKFGQLNPYGLDIAKSTNGAFQAGDLAVCNFNAKNNVQGTGFTVVALHPMPGSKPVLVSSDKTLLGCDALALSPNDVIWAAAFSANDNPVISSSGTLIENIKGKPFDRPFGQIFAQPTSGSPAFYETNAGNGTVVRINLGSTFTYDVIAKGFAINHGKPGSILGPSGLQYDPTGDTLYIVDGTNNTVTAFSNVSTIPAGGIIVGPGGMTFKGPSAKDARLVFAGSPLNGPISSALLFNGNLVIGNTGNPNGQNLMVELTPSGAVLDVRNVDKGPAAALFGMVATGTTAANTKLYFNDDNHNDLRVLEK